MAKGVPETHPEERQALNWSPKKNWVEKAGGLPSYINSVAVALVRGGMSRERAIPTAVNVVRKTCATGLWGGRTNAKVSPAIRAAACKAAAEWEAKKGGAKLSACAGCSKSLDLAGPVVTSKAGQPVTVNGLLQGMKPKHVKALAKANRNLQRSGMPAEKRKRVLRSMAKGLRSGKVSLTASLAGSRTVDLAFNPSETRGFHGRWVKTLHRIAKLKVGGDSVRVPLPASERRRTGLKVKRIERVASGGARQFRVQHAAHYTHHATPLAALHAAIIPPLRRGVNVRSFSHSVDLAFNPSQKRVSAGQAGGGQWTLGMVNQVAAVTASQQGQKITPGGTAPTDPRQIQALQKQLGLPVTGVYDQRTRDAVAAFQRAYGLKVDGIAGRQTLGTLHAARVASGHAAKGRGRGRPAARSSSGRTSARHVAALARHTATVRRRQQRQRQAAAKKKAREKAQQHRALAAVNAQRAKNRGLPSNAHMRALALRSKTASNSKARVQAARALAKIIRQHGSARVKGRKASARSAGRSAVAASRAGAAAAARMLRQRASTAARATRQQASAAKKAQAQRARSTRATSRTARIVTGKPKRAATPRKLVSKL